MKTKRVSIIMLIIVCCISWSMNIIAAEYDPLVEQVQKQLRELGYNPGPADGKMGKKTTDAIKSFQEDNGLLVTGEINDATLKKLGVSKETQQPESAESAPTPKPEEPPTPTEPKDPPEIKCSYSSCTVKNSLTDEMLTQIKEKDGNWEHKNLTLENVSNADLKKLSELKDLLEFVDFWQCPEVTDLTPLTKLNTLKTLQLRYADNLTDLSPLPDIKGLEKLSIYALKKLTDLTPIGKLESLKTLQITSLGEPIDLSPIANLTNLQELYISQGVKYTSFDFLESLNNLEILKFIGEPEDVTDISPLAGKTKLKQLAFNQADITDISILKDSTELERLELSGTKVEDLSVLRELKKLKYLYLNNIEVPDLDLSPVGELSELTYLNLTSSPFNDYSPIANCKKLETLEASYKSTFSDLNLLTGLANLKRLTLWENQKIQKWEPLAEMQSLESLSVGKTNFHDLKILKDLPNLRELSIQYCGVANPEAIATLPQLKYLYVNDSSGIEDISIFKKLSKIADLYVGHGTDQFPQEQLDILKQEKEEAAKLQNVFEEKFSDNRNNWYQGDDEQHTIRIEDKKYIFEHKRDTGYWAAWKKPEDFDPQKNFCIEVGANKVAGVDNYGYGIVLGAKDVNNFYQFLVNGNGSYSFGKVSDGKLSDIIEWTPSDSINKGNASNMLTVRKVGDQLKLYVNDRYVVETAFEDWLDTNVGFVVYNTMKVEFDHILIKN